MLDRVAQWAAALDLTGVVPLPVWWDGELNVAALGTALTALTTRHEVLRTRLVAGPAGFRSGPVE